MAVPGALGRTELFRLPAGRPPRWSRPPRRVFSEIASVAGAARRHCAVASRR